MAVHSGQQRGRRRMNVVVVGNGMVGQRFVEALLARETGSGLTVLAEESRPAYDRVRLSSFFEGATESVLNLAQSRGCDLHLGEPAVAIDRAARIVTTACDAYPYDALVLATGSYPFVPPID